MGNSPDLKHSQKRQISPFPEIFFANEEKLFPNLLEERSSHQFHDAIEYLK